MSEKDSMDRLRERLKRMEHEVDNIPRAGRFRSGTSEDQEESVDIISELKEIRDNIDRFGGSVGELLSLASELREAVGNRSLEGVGEAILGLRGVSNRLLPGEAYDEVNACLNGIENSLSGKYVYWDLARELAEEVEGEIQERFSNPFVELDNLHNVLLEQRKESDSKSLEKTVEHVENALGFDKSRTDRIVRELSSAVINFRRDRKGLSPSGAVLFVDEEAQRFYEWVREVGDFAREDVEEELSIGESKFFELLRKVRKKVRVDTEKRGSSPALYHYRGRISGE